MLIIPIVSRNESIFNKTLVSEVLFSGFLIGIIVFIVWFILIKKVRMDLALARGYIMVLMVFIQNIHVFNCRSEKNSAFNIPLRRNKFILFTIVFSVLLQIIVMEIPFLSNFLKTQPIPWSHMFILLSFALIILIAMEVYKLIKYKD